MLGGLCVAGSQEVGALPGSWHVGYVVVDADGWKADAEENASQYDVAHYAGLIEKAWREVAVVFDERKSPAEKCR